MYKKSSITEGLSLLLVAPSKYQQVHNLQAEPWLHLPVSLLFSPLSWYQLMMRTCWENLMLTKLSLVIPDFFSVFWRNVVSLIKVRLLLRIASVPDLKPTKRPSQTPSPFPHPLDCFVYTSDEHLCVSEHSNGTYFFKEAYTGKRNQGRPNCHKIQNVICVWGELWKLNICPCDCI